jgi:GntR family transcriptional regulator / MocR family aminotransferase
MTERGSRRFGAEGLDLHLGVYKAAGSVGRALETELREAIRSGRLHAGTRLPASRGLAADLGVSRGTVVQAYAQLTAEGWLVGMAGSGTRVADLPVFGSRPTTGGGPDPSPAAVRLAFDLRPGRPDLSSFPRTDWASSVRRALSAVPYESLDYTEPAGPRVLREAVAGYVTRARGVRADASAVVITAGFTAGGRDAGAGAGPRGVRGQYEQDAGPGDAAWVAGRACTGCMLTATGGSPARTGPRR